MMAASDTLQSRTAGGGQPRLREYHLQVSRYDHAASMVVALLVLVGVTVLTMLILWLSSRIFAGQEAVPFVMEEIGTGEGGLGGGMDLDQPMAEELGMESDLEEPSLENTLAAIADAVAAQQVLLADPTLTDQAFTGRGGSTGTGGTIGFGTGPGGSGRARHWEVRFIEGNTINTYARQLDYFGIDLGVLLPDNKVAYAFNLAKDRPDSRVGPADQEKRYYLTWRRGGLQEADRQLLAQADISSQGRIILKFLPRKLEEELAAKERAYAGDEWKNIRATYFGIRPRGGAYEFYVIDQSYK